MIKPSIEVQELRRRIYLKAKAEKMWQLLLHPWQEEME